MMEDGLVLMGAGMGTVALFLTLMVLAVHASAAIIRRVEGNKAAKTAASGKGSRAAWHCAT